jgi:hypothetical protein
MNLNSVILSTIEDQGAEMSPMLLGALIVLMVTAALATEDVNTASANTTNAMIWGRCSGIIHGLIEMFGLLQEEQAAGEIQLNQRLCTVIPEGVTPPTQIQVFSARSARH